MKMTIVWLIIMIGFLGLEGLTVALTSLWFAVGCLAAMLVCALGGPAWLQGLVFLTVSLLLLLCLKPIVRKYLKPRLSKTNVDAIPGKTGIVIEAIDNHAPAGQVKLDGSTWTARSTSGCPIAEGTLVKVDRIQGVKAYVTPVPPQG